LSGSESIDTYYEVQTIDSLLVVSIFSGVTGSNFFRALPFGEAKTAILLGLFSSSLKIALIELPYLNNEISFNSLAFRSVFVDFARTSDMILIFAFSAKRFI
jgi:hypothetical protein